MRDNVSKLGTVFSWGLPAAKTTTTTGAAIDLAPFNAATIYILAGTWTDGTHTWSIQESDSSGSGFTAVANSDLVAWSATSATDYTPVRVGNAQPTAISSAATALNWRIGYIGGKRYIKVVNTVTGSPSTGAVYDVVVIAGEARVEPSAV